MYEKINGLWCAARFFFSAPVVCILLDTNFIGFNFAKLSIQITSILFIILKNDLWILMNTCIQELFFNQLCKQPNNFLCSTVGRRQFSGPLAQIVPLPADLDDDIGSPPTCPYFLYTFDFNSRPPLQLPVTTSYHIPHSTGYWRDQFLGFSKAILHLSINTGVFASL